MIVGILLKFLTVMSSRSGNKHSFHHLTSVRASSMGGFRLLHLGSYNRFVMVVRMLWCVEMCHIPPSKIRSASRDMRTKPWPKAPERTEYVETTPPTSLRDLSQTPCSVHRSRPVKTLLFTERIGLDVVHGYIARDISGREIR